MRSHNVVSQLAHRVRHFIKTHGLSMKPGPLVVGVSGGADSVCLLHLLVRLSGETGIDLHIVHLNHQLRGAESDADAAYVSHLAETMGIPATSAAVDVQGYRARKRLSVEEAAREVRYAFFSEVAQSIGADRVAVGHTSNDQAETVLMHLIRGAGLSGLCGMQPISRRQLNNDSHLTVIRPLLEISREETELYCDACGLSTRTDSSNASGDYLRNRIRGDLIPLLQRYNPNIRHSLSRLSDCLQADADYISSEASRLWGGVAVDCAEGVSIDNRAFGELPLSLKRHLLRLAWQRLTGSTRDIGQAHIESMLDVLQDSAGKRLSLPDGLYLHGGYGRSLITREESTPCPFEPLDEEHPLVVPGETVVSGWRVKARVRENRGEMFEDAPYAAFFDFDQTGAGLTLRARREGDRFQPLGMKNYKKLQDFMVDAKIPRAWRDRVPLVCAPGRILWVVGWRIDDRAKVTPVTRRVLRLEFETEL